MSIFVVFVSSEDTYDARYVSSLSEEPRLLNLIVLKFLEW